MFKYSVNEGIYGQEPMKASIERIAHFGYDGVEIAGEPHSLNVRAVKELLKTNGLPKTNSCKADSPVAREEILKLHTDQSINHMKKLFQELCGTARY